MIKINELIYAIANKLGVDIPLELESEIKFHILTERSRLIREAIVKYGRDEWHIQTIEVPLFISTDSNCNGCKVLSSSVIPITIRDNNNIPFVAVTTLNNEVIESTTEDTEAIMQHSRFTGKKLKYFLKNDKIIVKNSLSLKKIRIKAVFEDPLSFSNYNLDCVSCESPANDYLPLHSDLVPILIENVLKFFTLAPRDSNTLIVNENDNK